MTKHLSVATAIEKNRIASDKAFVILAALDVYDETGAFVETVRLAQNSENIDWQGDTYEASNFKIDLSDVSGQEPSLKIDAKDPSGFIRERMNSYGGGVGFSCVVTVINTGNIDQAPEVQEEFLVIDASQAGYDVSFTLGVDNPLKDRFPRRLLLRDQCTVRYKGSRCKYAGGLAACDFTYAGLNGCGAHSNQVNFGGFRGIQTIFSN